MTKKEINIAVQLISPCPAKDIIKAWMAAYLETTGHPKECKACPMKSTCAPKIHCRKISEQFKMYSICGLMAGKWTFRGD